VSRIQARAKEEEKQKRTYLGSPVLRSALRVGQLPLAALAAVEAIVTTAVCAGGHHAWAADGGIDVLVVRAGAGALDVAVSMGRVVRGANNGGELCS
jgi:O-acetyl-ADP-ribose deacetylase (regulator of RNase III)